MSIEIRAKDLVNWNEKLKTLIFHISSADPWNAIRWLDKKIIDTSRNIEKTTNLRSAILFTWQVFNVDNTTKNYPSTITNFNISIVIELKSIPL